LKPLHIILLVAAGAIGGAVIMKVTQSPASPPAAVAQAPAPSSVATPAQAPQEPAAAPIPEQAPAPQRARREPAPVHHRPQSHPAPVQVAQNQPPAVVPAAPAPAPQPQEQAPLPPREPEPAAPPAPPPPPPPQQATLKAGTLIPVRVIDGLSSDRSMPGDQFAASLDQPLVVDGFVIAERGARLEGRVVGSDKGGKVKGVASISVELTRLHTSDGQTVAINTDAFVREAETSKKTDAAKVGAGAAIGAAIGAIAGGGKGAAIGAGVGGGAGAGDVLLTRGKAAAIPSETRISFRLREPVTLTERSR
jgi:hypothetical protein